MHPSPPVGRAGLLSKCRSPARRPAEPANQKFPMPICMGNFPPSGWLCARSFYCGCLRAQVLAKIQLGKFFVLWQCQLKTLQPVDLERQLPCAQPQDMAALGLIAAEEVEVPPRQVDALYIPGAIDGDDTARHIGIVEFPLAKSRPPEPAWGTAFGRQSSCAHAWC